MSNATAPTKDDAVEEVVVDYTMIPGHPLWQAKKYFDSQPKVTVFVEIDHQNKHFTHHTMSINGFPWTIELGKHERVPLPFARILEDAKRGHILPEA